MLTEKEIFNRTELLLGADTMKALSEKRVILFGVGGVGSWCAEGLVRSGITRLTLVDPDCIAPSNLNRQLMATVHTVGRVKVEALKERLLEINPHARITAVREVYSKETSGQFPLDAYEYVIDAVDSLKDKIHLLLQASASRATLFSSMGAALKIDPTRVQVAEFWKVKGCPLAAAIRRQMRHSGIFPKKPFLCVYGTEVRENRESVGAVETDTFNKARINGAVAPVTAIFGMTLAGLLLKDVADRRDTQAVDNDAVDRKP